MYMFCYTSGTTAAAPPGGFSFTAPGSAANPLATGGFNLAGTHIQVVFPNLICKPEFAGNVIFVRETKAGQVKEQFCK